MLKATENIVSDALAALNEILSINGVDTVAPQSDIAARIHWHVSRELRKTEPKKPVGRPRNDRGVSDMQTINNRAHWCSFIATEFVIASRCFWQVLGLDEHGELWARVVDEKQDFIGKPVKFDRRMKPRPVAVPAVIHASSRPLRNHNDSGHAIRREMKLTTQGLF